MIPAITALLDGVVKRFVGSEQTSVRTTNMTAAQRTRSIAADVSPNEIEAELRCQLHEALKHLDNVVDLLALAALQKKQSFDKTQHFIIASEPSNPICSVKLDYRKKFRSFSIFWRMLWVREPGSRKHQAPKYEYLSLREESGSVKDLDDRNYPLTAFRRIKNPELKGLAQTTEEQMRLLRESMQLLKDARGSVRGIDKKLTTFFDEILGADASGRVKSAELNAEWPFEENANAQTYVLDVDGLQRKIDTAAADKA